jgi:exopolysaccharide production protein ExoQ
MPCERIGCWPAGPATLFRALEHLFVFLLLFSSMNVITAFMPASREQTEIRKYSADVDTFSVALEGAVYVYGAVLALTRWRRVLRAARIAWPLLALAGLACLSTAWSVEPMVTFRRSVSLLAATIVSIYLGERYSIKAFARLLAQAFCLMIALVLVVYSVAPEYVIDQSAYGGAWRGLSAYKNAFGEHMAIAVLLLVLVRFQRFGWLRYVFLPMAAGFLLLSRSATAVVCGVLGVAAVPLWRLMRSKQGRLVYPLAIMMFSLGMYCVLAFPEALFQILGRDTTLTGRTRLWGILLPVMANHPILGYGYDAFWAGLKPEVLSVWIDSERLVPAADNGYIELFLSLGALGVCVFLYVFVIAFRRATEYVSSEQDLISLWPVTYLCIFAADSICESELLTRGAFTFLVFAILTTSLAMSNRRVVTSVRRVEDQRFMPEYSPRLISR